MYYRWYNDKKSRNPTKAPPAPSLAKGKGKKGARAVLTNMVNHSTENVTSSDRSGSELSDPIAPMSEAELEVASILVGLKYRTPV